MTAMAALAAMAAMAIMGASSAMAEPPAPDQAVRLERLSVEAHERDALLTLGLSAPVAAHIFAVHSPERLVIDLAHTRRIAPLPIPPSGAVVLRLRAGYPQPHQLRLVLDLAQALPWRRQSCAARGPCIVQIRLGDVGALPAADAHAQPIVELPAAQSAPQSTAQSGPQSTAQSGPQSTVQSAPQSTAHPGSQFAAPPSVHVAAHAPPAGERTVIVAVDAGHGGMDPGATGAAGTHEKDVTLAIARALAACVDGQSGMHAVLTRDGDYFVPLRNRMERAAAARADMFVSIHADAMADREVAGASVYILSERGASSEAARMLADHENAADLKGGISLSEQSPDLRPLLLSLSQSASMGASGEAADRVLGALDGVGAVRKREVQQAAFVVLKSPDIPSLLVETAYISNPAEERSLRNPAQQRRLAGAIFDGIRRYFQQFPPEGSAFARSRESGSTEIARNAP